MNRNVTIKEEIALRDDERQPCEVWTRVMGYHRPVSSFNRGSCLPSECRCQTVQQDIESTCTRRISTA